ncbi:unnamed protein product [Ambrosiozyma monospora]|uniref:Unnamed protein product n=1 Tax=Ambrosiozyma monospora TaxID=43982 RepID=A0ACB5UAK8_AMBMO|nr:unnamed protein product [Ambrosiozyma monospora]
MDTPGPVLEFMIPQLSARQPKLVAANVKAMNDIYAAFGCSVCPPKIALDVLPKLFGHADRNVRSEAIKLSVTIRSYIGKTFDTLIMEKLKPAQQKELNKAFELIQGVPKPPRLLKSQQIQEAAATQNGDVEMADADADDGTGEMDEEDAALAAYNLVDPVDF